MPVPSYQLRCLRNDRIARGVYEFAFEKPAELTFKGGQFVLFDVALKDDPANIQTRAFSIASSPHEQELLFVAKMKEGGRASVWIEETLKPGSIVRTQGPFGNFKLDRETDKDYLFVATSTGVAPFRSQMLEALFAGDTRRMDLIMGVRDNDEFFWMKEFEELTQKYSNVFFHPALSGTEESWTGHRGRVQTLVPLIAPDMTRKSVYVCGSPNMTKELKQICLEQWGMEKKDLHVEGYI